MGGSRIQFRDKLIIVDETLVIGASGEVSLCDTFRDRIRVIVDEYRKTKNIDILSKSIEETTNRVNREYEHKLHSRDFDLILALRTPDAGLLLKYVYPDGYSENVYTFRVLGLGEPYGLVFLRKLWHSNISMIEAAELGYRVISYIERFDLNGSVGIGDGRPQIVFMTNDGRLRKASESLLYQLDDSCKKWLQRFEVSIREAYRPSLTVDGYVYGKKWKMSCAGDGGLSYPEGIDIDSSGHVYVAAQGSRCVEKFDGNGEFISMLKSKGTEETRFEVPFALAIDSLDSVYVSENESSSIQKFDKSGKFLVMWGNRGTDIGQFSSPHGLCVDNGGNVYVTEETNHRIQKFKSNGEFVTKWGVYGTGDGEFNRPHGVTFDASDKLFVTDSLNHRIQVFSTEGRFITKWGSEGSEDGQMKVPRDLVVDVTGNVYVSDGGNSRIQMFAPAWKYVSDLDFFNEGGGSNR